LKKDCILAISRVSSPLMLKLRTIFGFFKNTLDWTVLIVCILIWWVSSEWFSLKWEQRGEHHPWYHLEWYPTNFGAKESTNTQPNFEHLFAYTRPTLVMTMLILSFASKWLLWRFLCNFIEIYIRTDSVLGGYLTVAKIIEIHDSYTIVAYSQLYLHFLEFGQS